MSVFVTDEGASSRWARAGALIPVVLLLPFLNKAYHVDDTLFVYAAQRVAESPLDFYGFDVNWYTSPQPMSEVMQNPPLQAYWLALFGALFGWEEWVLHGAMLLPAFAACWLTALLAGRFGVSPFWAALGLGLSPGFFVSATQVMCDVTFLALYPIFRSNRTGSLILLVNFVFSRKSLDYILDRFRLVGQ